MISCLQTCQSCHRLGIGNKLDSKRNNLWLCIARESAKFSGETSMQSLLLHYTPWSCWFFPNIRTRPSASFVPYKRQACVNLEGMLQKGE